jgi:GntR family transcriptional regulator
MIDRSSPVPLYHQLSELIQKQILSGQLKPGEAIPTEQELIRLSRVSRITVRKAVDELERKGYVRREQGRGTFVTPRWILRGMANLTSFSEDLIARGMEPGSRLLTLQKQPATLDEAHALGVEEGESVWFIERLRLADSEPIALNTSYARLPEDVTLTASELEDEKSLWALLERKGIVVVAADMTTEAISADDQLASLLQVPISAPLLQVEAVAYTGDCKPVEYSQVVARADRYKRHWYVTR